MRIIYAAALLWFLASGSAEAQMTAAERLAEAKDLLKKEGVPCEVMAATELALRNLQALLKEHPDDPEVPFAEYLSGVCLIRLGRYDEAVKPLEDAARSPVDSRGRENILWHLAFAYFRSLNYVRAKEAYETFLQEFPESRNADEAKKVLAPLRMVGTRANLFKATDISGQPLDLKALMGRPLLLHFWATWCPPCRQELPNIKKAFDEFHGKGLQFVGVSLDTDIAVLTDYIKANGVSWPHYCDGQKWNSPLAKVYNVNSVPMLFLIDRAGVIRYADIRSETLFRAIGILLEEK
ncbi:MAG: redoxin domain-containing protein [Planctomycetota bacterium]